MPKKRTTTGREELRTMLNDPTTDIITVKDMTAAGIWRGEVKTFVDQQALVRCGRGLYVKQEAWPDDLYLLQQRYPRGIFSHDTALYLLGYSDRVPLTYEITFPKGYNSVSLKQTNVAVKRVIPEIYNKGITEIESGFGHKVKIYELERTLCDIVRGKGSEIQIVLDAMRRYAQSPDKDMMKLMQYAKLLHVAPKIMNYMRVLL